MTFPRLPATPSSAARLGKFGLARASWLKSAFHGGAVMRFGKRILRDRTQARSRSVVRRTNRLLVETLERRGMLSATVGSLADQVVDDVTPAEEYETSVETLPGAGDGSIGLPEGVSPMICPMVNWAENDLALIASNAFNDGVAAESLSDPSSPVLGGEELLMCTGYPAPRFTLPGPSDSADVVESVTTELSPYAWERAIDDPRVLIDPVVVDPVAFEPGGAASYMSFTSFDDQAVRPGFTPQDADHGSPRFATGASNSRLTGELAAAAMWMNFSSGDTGSMHLPGSKRRSR